MWTDDGSRLVSDQIFSCALEKYTRINYEKIIHLQRAKESKTENENTMKNGEKYEENCFVEHERKISMIKEDFFYTCVFGSYIVCAFFV